MILNPDKIIEECLEMAFNLKTYKDIIDFAASSDFCATEEFRKTYNGFYRVRQRKPEWYELYYSLMEKQKSDNASFEALLWKMYEGNGSVEVSFISKLIATINPELPIWDQYVIRNLGYENEWRRLATAKAERKIKKAVEIYDSIIDWYADYVKSDEGLQCIAKFDDALPNYKELITNTKKIDYLLWIAR